MCAQGFEALEQDAHGRDLLEEYPQYSGYRCQDCIERKNLALRPPFHYLTMLQHTSGTTRAPDDAPDGHFRVVFTLRQKEHLLRCGYVELDDSMSNFHMSGNKLNGFQLLPVEDAGQPSSAQHSFCVDATLQNTASVSTPLHGLGVDTLQMPACLSLTIVHLYETLECLRKQVEEGTWISGPSTGTSGPSSDIFITPMYCWPSTKHGLSKHFSLNNSAPSSDKDLTNFRQGVLERLQEYYNIMQHTHIVWPSLTETRHKVFNSPESMVPGLPAFTSGKWFSKSKCRQRLPVSESSQDKVKSTWSALVRGFVTSHVMGTFGTNPITCDGNIWYQLYISG